jgi:fused signal recognition particle receptor
VTVFLLVGTLVGVVVVGWLLLRRRRRPHSPLRRDAPTFEEAEPSRPRLGTRLGEIFSRQIDSLFWDSLEEALIAADVGVAKTASIVERVRAADPSDPQEARLVLREMLVADFGSRDRSIAMVGSPAVIVVVGVNGSGKTTTIAKMAASHIAAGRSVLVAAADTFRAAAAEQVISWGSRIGFDTVRGSDGADPAAVAFDALSAAQARGVDVLIVDTAGRLHSKQNLMDELAKVVRVLGRESGSVDEVLLVLDGSTGQNGIAQAKAFTAAVGVTGIVVTKLDGTAKGGSALAVEHDLDLPLKLIGVGEGPGDLLHFDPGTFVDELLGDA